MTEYVCTRCKRHYSPAKDKSLTYRAKDTKGKLISYNFCKIGCFLEWIGML